MHNALIRKLKWIPKKMRPPALVDAYRRKRPGPTGPVVPNVADAPFGVQQSTYLQVLGDNGKDGKSFILPLQKLTFQYCDLGGSSKGIRYPTIDLYTKLLNDNA
jgi:hypothetical protein